MFKLKYNFLSGINVLLGLANFSIFMSLFGISIQSDAYLLAGVTIITIQLIQMLFFEQFMIFYNEYKSDSAAKGYSFYVLVLFFSFMIGVITLISLYCLIDYIVIAFGGGFSEIQKKLYLTFLFISMIELLVVPIFIVNQKVLNAESHFSMPYILSTIPQIGVLAGSLFLLFSEIKQAEYILYFRVIFVYLAMILSVIYIKNFVFSSFKYKMLISWKDFYYFVKNSFTMRVGHNMHNIFFMPLITNHLSGFPVGSVSYFFYAYKFVSIIGSVVTGPSTNILNAMVSREWAISNRSKVDVLIKQFLKIAPVLLVLVTVLAYFFIPLVLPFLVNEFDSSTINTLMYMFLVLSIWNLIVVLESPAVALLIANKNSIVFITVNGVFMLTLYFGLNVLTENNQVYSVAYFLIFSQFISLFLYSYAAKKSIKSL